VAKGSSITSLAQLKGKKVSFPAKGFNFGSMAADIQMQPYHLSSASFTTVALPFPAAPQAVASGAVDAAFTTEPFITIMESSGARMLVDLLGGPLAGFPVSCWGTTQSFVSKNPKTVAAFARAVQRGAADASASRQLVEQTIPTFTKIDKQTAALLKLPLYPTSLDAKRLQRVADLMQTYGLLQSHLDVSTMVVATPPSS